MTLEEFDDAFEARFVRFYGLRLLRPEDALSYIDEGYANGLILQGMDGLHFLMGGGAIQPDMSLDRDIIHYTDLDQFLEESKTVIRSTFSDPSVVFEVTLIERSKSYLQPLNFPSSSS